VVLCLHGEPSWSYLYRHMIGRLARRGARVLAPDLVGFGRSDKPERRDDHSYAAHVNWMLAWLQGQDLEDITLVAQDWGGLIGLRLVAAAPGRFARLALSNTALPTGDHPMPEAFERWRAWSQQSPDFDPGLVCNEFGRGALTEAEMDAYRAPFPNEAYLAGPRQMPTLVPTTRDDPERDANRAAWARLIEWPGPVLLCFSDGDPITRNAEAGFRERLPGARGQPHRTLKGGHFVQESAGPEWAGAIADWMGLRAREEDTP
jgi:haloalkane dehalogenase